MNDQILQDILRRLVRLEQTAVRYRAGEVTDVAPLDVALGGSDVSYEDVKAIGPVEDGDQVATLLWGNDLLVIGAIMDGSPVHFIGGAGEPTFTGAWVNFDNSATTPAGGANRDAGFYKADGRVYLTGTIKTGTSGTAAFTLPAGYTPKASVECLVGASGGVAKLAITSSGTVTPANVSPSAVATYCYLDGASFAVV